MKRCAFCEIVDGKGEAEVVLETEHVVAFLDRRPLFPGHVLVVPREHHVTLEDLPKELVEPLFTNVRTLCRVVPRALSAEGSFTAINNRVSQSVLHLHVHVVPRSRGDGLRGFFSPRHSYTDSAHRSAVAEAIRAELSQG